MNKKAEFPHILKIVPFERNIPVLKFILNSMICFELTKIKNLSRKGQTKQKQTKNLAPTTLPFRIPIYKI